MSKPVEQEEAVDDCGADTKGDALTGYQCGTKDQVQQMIAMQTETRR